MKTKATLAVIMSAAVAACTAFADTYTDGNGVEWNYTIVSGTNVRLGNLATLTGDHTKESDVQAISDDVNVDASTIPWTFTNNGTDYTVTEIAAAAFYNRPNLVGTLCFPVTVKALGQRAFQKCDGLTALTSLGGVTNLDYYVFNESKNLGGNFPDISGVSVLGAGSFQMAGQNGGMTGTVRISKNVTTILQRTFRQTCISGTVLVSANVTSIGEMAFNAMSNLEGAWIAGVPYVTSGTQNYTTANPANGLFGSTSANKLTVFGPNTQPTSGKSLSNIWAGFGSDVKGILLLPNNGKWTGFTLNSPNATVDFYDFAMVLDEDAGVVKITATTAEQLEQALTYAPKFKSVFGFDTRISVTEAIDLADVTITDDMTSGATFDRLMFSAKNQTQLNAILGKFPATVPISIDPTGLTENMVVPETYANVYVKTVPGVTIKRTASGFMIVIQ